MAHHITKERTLVIIKPDGVQRGLVGEIIGRIERTGLKIAACKMMIPTREQCWEHYKKDDVWFTEKGNRIMKDREAQGLPIEKEALEYGKDIIEAILRFMTAGPVVAMVIQGNQAIGVVKKIVGATEPLTSDVGTIRGDLTIDSYELSSVDGRAVRNLVHCSDQPAEAEREIAIWFSPEEIINYRLMVEQTLYDVSWDGILE